MRDVVLDLEEVEASELRTFPTASAEQLYSSLPLSHETRSIRLLDLDASTRDLTGHLRVVRLQDSPPFTALSYVWGSGPSDAEPSHTISVLPCLEPRCLHTRPFHSCSLDITKNCYSALQQVRSRFG